ncbi:hypothetical protein HYFRA_00004649 [Hymenoscyphus fraxineus]|uniref:Beta-xylanase n=1 Tax=Hymenoscyphus fraxineus TaxID=746836 RepID=A0A9N9PPK4_9HELO|nr:hypothetical protein HYFRA_00004649 [Hymenoscyphus fraxineus]
MYIALFLPLLVPVAQAQLHTLAVAAGLKYLGSATDNGELTDTALVAILSNTSEFGQITPGNTMKWDSIEREPDTFTFEKGDVIADLAKKNNQTLRCHTLVWHQQLPKWVTGGTWTKETLTAALQNHVTKTVTHYKGQCYAWDVVNEALEQDGTFRKSIFFNTIGEEYIKIAFEAAAAADPDVKLYYNDFNIENPGQKSTAALNIARSLQSSETKIDGMGVQAHFIVGSTPSRKDQIATLQSYTALGLEVAYTELDIRMKLPSTPELEIQQSKDYENSVGACVAVKGCVGITVWDFTDKYSWVPQTFPGQGAALPFDENFNRKKAYFGIIAGLSGGSAASNSTNPAKSVKAVE